MENKRQLTKEITACKNSYLAGRIVSDEEIALASYSILDDYRWAPEPTPPRKVEDYYKMPVDLKKKMNAAADAHRSFWDDPAVKDFFNLKERIKNQNDRNKSWLKWMKEVLATAHADKVVAIDIKIYKFTDTGIDQPKWDE